MNNKYKMVKKTALLSFIAVAAVTSLGLAEDLETLNISPLEAKSFLELRMKESYPALQVVIKEKGIVIKPGTPAAICYSTDCWPVKKEDGKLIDIAAETVAPLLPVRVQFSRVNDGKVGEHSFAIEISDGVYAADILRYLQKYRAFSPYTVKFAPKMKKQNDPAWISAEYFENGEWHRSQEVCVSYSNIGHLEEIYDSDPRFILRGTANDLKKDPFYLENGYSMLSPWRIFPTAMYKEGVLIAGEAHSDDK